MPDQTVEQQEATFRREWEEANPTLVAASNGSRPPRAMPTNHRQQIVLRTAKCRLNPAFTFEELLVASWKERPDEFGLTGYLIVFPDARTLCTCLYGKRGLLTKGYLRKRHDGRYEVC